MNAFEKVIKDKIVSLIDGKLDPLQFAYQAGKGVNDAKLFILDKVYKHLEEPKSHARILFADFSSAFNKMQAHILIDHLASHFKLPDQFLVLLLEFLTNRIQYGCMSSIRLSNTGSPQGCVLSPPLFIMYTDNCRTSQEGSYIVKFSVDTALLTLLQGQDSDHGQALPAFIKWCDDHFLDLNVSKTKELIIDFRQSQDTPRASTIHNEEVQIVDSYKYLGTMFESQLKFKENTELIVKQHQQGTHLMRKLRSFNVCDTILCNFYRSSIESLLTFSFICWFNGLSMKEKNSLNTVVKICSKIIGVQQRNFGTI